MLATELKNNSCKLGKWTCSAILAGSEYLKLGYETSNSEILIFFSLLVLIKAFFHFVLILPSPFVHLLV